ncbi:MAG: alpha/beta fold hydrolase [Oligoflexales bacterium]
MHQSSKTPYHENNVGIHLFHTIQKSLEPTLLFLPAMAGEAIDGFRSLAPCLASGFNVASMSFRGRGRSTTPTEGYKFIDHAGDIKLVLGDLKVNKIVLVACGISVIYAAYYLQEYGLSNIAGLVILGHPWRVNKAKMGWAEELSKIRFRGKPVTATMRKAAMVQIERESTAVDLYLEYEGLKLPTLVMHTPINKGLLTG